MKVAKRISIKRPDWLIARYLWNDIASASKYTSGILLDLGCGKKPYSVLFDRHIKRYIGFDIPASVSKEKNDVDFYASALYIPCRTSSIDSVLCIQLIEHIPEPQRVLVEIARVLKAGGHLILTAPRTWFIHEAPSDYFRFTEYGLKYLAESNGPEVVLIKQEGSFVEMIAQQIIPYLSYKFGNKPRTFSARLVLLISILIGQSSVLFASSSMDKFTTINYLLVARKPSSRNKNTS